MSVAARPDVAAQRRMLALMSIDVYVPRARIRPGAARLLLAGPAGAGGWRVAVAGLARWPLDGPDAALFAALARALGVTVDGAAWLADGVGVPEGLPLVGFGTPVAGSTACIVPAFPRLREEPGAKRQAWQAMRTFARRLRSP